MTIIGPSLVVLVLESTGVPITTYCIYHSNLTWDRHSAKPIVWKGAGQTHKMDECKELPNWVMPPPCPPPPPPTAKANHKTVHYFKQSKPAMAVKLLEMSFALQPRCGHAEVPPPQHTYLCLGETTDIDSGSSSSPAKVSQAPPPTGYFPWGKRWWGAKWTFFLQRKLVGLKPDISRWGSP